MDNQNSREQVSAAEIAAEAAAQPTDIITGVKSGLVKLPARQILKLIFLALGLIAWYPIYSRLDPFSRWVAYDVLRIAPGTHLGESVAFFFLDIPKVFMLLLLIVWAVGVVRSFFTPERTRAILLQDYARGRKTSVYTDALYERIRTDAATGFIRKGYAAGESGTFDEPSPP